MAERRPPKAPQRYQPLPAGQTIIILTDKNQLMPKELKDSGVPMAETIDGQSPKPGEKNLPKPDNAKSVPKISAAFKDGRCRVTYSIDMFEAFLLIEPPRGGKWPTVEEAVKLIQSEKIVNYDMDAVTDAIERHRTNPVRIAQGKPVMNGQDTELKVNYELNDLHKIYIEGLVEDNFGRVNFHEVKTVQTAVLGDRVAEKVMCTAGEDGVDVHGRIIPAVPGVDRPIKLGKNVAWDEEGLYVIATSGGKPTMINNILNVLPIHEVKGNIDFHTGNISFDGDLIIHGNVENGFKVEAGGDIVITGYVEAAEVTAGGRLSVKGRVFGNDRGKLICDSDFYAKEVEHVTIICRGTVTVDEAVLHCRVLAEKRVVTEHGKGWIVGGSVHAGEEILARSIGSRLSTITDIEVGPNVLSKIYDYLNSSNQSGGDAATSPDTAAAEGTDDSRYQVSSVTDTVEPDNSLKPKGGRIRFKDIMYPGVRVSFEPFKFIIQNELNFGSLSCNEGYLHLLPYR
jgi:uncharacterized protein (DUF342 family)